MRTYPILLFLSGIFLMSCNPAAEEKKVENEEKESALFRDEALYIPKSLSNIYSDENHRLYAVIEGDTFRETPIEPYFTLAQARGQITGTETGLRFEFGKKFDGTLYYGFIPYDDYRHPQPVFFKRPIPIENGVAELPILDNLEGKYDMIGWSETGRGTIGYRVVDHDGTIVYDGKVAFEGAGPFAVDTAVIAGPFLSQPQPTSMTLWFETNVPTEPKIRIDGQMHAELESNTVHTYTLQNLRPATRYTYSIETGNQVLTFDFETPPQPGSREPFTFAYASDSRNGQGGGERNVYGANAYIMKKMAALAVSENARFFQFTGDLIDGYLTDPDEMNLQYVNWKQSIESFAHYMPVYTVPGNHESSMFLFANDSGNVALIDQFPYKTVSASAVFAQHFANPVVRELKNELPTGSGLSDTDFPPYDETVYSYTYDNIAFICMNSNYWYSSTLPKRPQTGGGLHGYIMDQQLAWVKRELQRFEEDANIDHVFVTEHTPFFPNGGHVHDDMWYHGNNAHRPVISGKPVAKGIIERRDELLDAIVNGSSKVRAIFTGDEHNYCRTEVGPNTPIYPEDWKGEKIELSRTIHQINNGAAGAPYYAQEQTPWTPFTSGFSTQNALVLVDVDGDRVIVRVINPDTLEEVDYFSVAGGQ